MPYIKRKTHMISAIHYLKNLSILMDFCTICINIIHHPKFHAKIPPKPTPLLKYIFNFSYFS